MSQAHQGKDKTPLHHITAYRPGQLSTPSSGGTAETLAMAQAEMRHSFRIKAEVKLGLEVKFSLHPHTVPMPALYPHFLDC